MRTADVHIELVYILAANRNVRHSFWLSFNLLKLKAVHLQVGESLRKFGINDKVTRVCVVLFDATEDKVLLLILS